MFHLLESDIKQCITEKTPACLTNMKCNCRKELRSSESDLITVETTFDADLGSYSMRSYISDWLDTMSICWVEKFDVQLSHDKTSIIVKLLVEGCINKPNM